MGLKNSAIKGIVYSGSSVVYSQAIQFLSKLVLARILSPKDFGIMSLVVSIGAVMNIFFSLGWYDKIIEKKQDTQKIVNTIFLITTIAGLIFFISMIFLSQFISDFFMVSEAGIIFKVYAITFLLQSIVFTYQTYLQKNLFFSKKVLGEMLSSTVFFFTSLVLAIFGYGALSLVVGQVLQLVVLALLLMVSSAPWKPKFIFDQNAFHETWQFVKESSVGYIFGISILYIDNLFVGRYFGIETLGFYAMAFTLANLPVITITHTISGVSFPILATTIGRDKLKNYFIKTVYTNFLIYFPIIIFSTVFADMIITFLLSAKWQAIVPLFKILVCYSLFRSFCNLASFLALAVGKPSVMKKIYVIEFSMLMTTMVPLAFVMGVSGVAVSILLSRVASAGLFFIFVNSFLGARIQEYIAWVYKTVVLSIISGVFSYGSMLFLPENIFGLFMTAFLFVASYGSLTLFLDKFARQETVNIIETFKNKFNGE